MVSVLFDTNILIDHFNGIKEATAELARYEDAAITTITWVELLTGGDPHQLQDMRDLMRTYTIFDLDEVAAEDAGALRRSIRMAKRAAGSGAAGVMRTPDAIILTTAKRTGRILITRNSKDFAGSGVHVPYTVTGTVITVNPVLL